MDEKMNLREATYSCLRDAIPGEEEHYDDLAKAFAEIILEEDVSPEASLARWHEVREDPHMNELTIKVVVALALAGVQGMGAKAQIVTYGMMLLLKEAREEVSLGSSLTVKDQKNV